MPMNLASLFFRGGRISFAACAFVLAISIAHAGDPDALLKIMHDQCVPDEEVHHNPAPCVRVDLNGGMDRGYVILKDRVGVAQFLLIATRRISGIESPDLLAPDMPNYWADAWQNRTFVSAAVQRNLPADEIGMAINSALARSQNQFHIHIDCLRPDVRALLAVHRDEIGLNWVELPFDLPGGHYFARRLDNLSADPFRLLAQGVAGAAQHMREETLVVAGLVFAPGHDGFVLLSSHADPAKGERAHGEDLLDHSCALAK